MVDTDVYRDTLMDLYHARRGILNEYSGNIRTDTLALRRELNERALRHTGDPLEFPFDWSVDDQDDVELVDYLDEDDDTTTLCEPCAGREGLLAFGVGPTPTPARCDGCGRRSE